MVSYRSGDMFAPKVDLTEALSYVEKEFADCIIEKRKPLTDGEAGLKVVSILEACEHSIRTGGANVKIQY